MVLRGNQRGGGKAGEARMKPPQAKSGVPNRSIVMDPVDLEGSAEGSPAID